MAERFWDKFGFQRLQQNRAFMNCAPDLKGIFLDLRIMAGNSEYEDGSIPIGNIKRAKFDDLLDFFTDFGDAKNKNYFRKKLERLVKVGALSVTAGKVVKIAGYEEEQGLGRTIDTNRKREDAKIKFQENVNRAGAYLKTVFTKSQARALPYDMLHASIRQRSGCIKKTADALLTAMIDNGVLVCVGDGGLYALASLASPPVAGAGSTGAGPENVLRNFPVESEPESEPELAGENSSPQLGAGQLVRPGPKGSVEPSGASGPGTGGGRSERSENNYFASGSEPDRSDSPNWMASPEDAFQVSDPLLATKFFLQTMPGWCEEPRRGTNDVRTWRVLRSKWMELGEKLGESDRDSLWRSHLREIFEDRYDKDWKSFSSIFVSRIGKSAALLSGGAGGE
jgi:hypothetical protein